MPESSFFRSIFSRSHTLNRKKKDKSKSRHNPLPPLPKTPTSTELAIFADANPSFTPKSKEEPIFGGGESTIIDPCASFRRSSTTTLHRYSISTSYATRKLTPLGGKKVVLYTTSLRTIRRTYEDCRAVKAILRGLMVAVDERDLSMDASYRRELLGLLGGRQLPLPRAFIGKMCLGGVEDIRFLHENGELEKLLEREGVASESPGFICRYCGGLRFLPCANCNGSRRVFDEDEHQFKFCFLCNEHGLVRCEECA